MGIDPDQCEYEVVASTIRPHGGEAVISTTDYLDALTASVSLKQTGKYYRIRIYKRVRKLLHEWHY